MKLQFNQELALPYISKSQQARVLTENWAESNLFCPICGCLHLQHLTANRPVADFLCDDCGAEFELKSARKHRLPAIFSDGAYDTMIKRITSFNNPHFFFMTYEQMAVSNLYFVPKHFFTPGIITKRKPLASTARRAGWVGCNIDISAIPQSCKVAIVQNNQVMNHVDVLREVQRANKLYTSSITNRGWLMDVLFCLQKIKDNTFKLSDVYTYTDWLQKKHPNNQHVQAKIRQQLQILRDKGYIKFLQPGLYSFIRNLSH